MNGQASTLPDPEVTRLREDVRRLTAELDEQRRRSRETEHRYRGLVDRLDAIFWEADVESFQFTFVSPRAEALLGYPLQQWIEERDFWVHILHPEDREWVVASCQAAIAEGRDNDFDYRVIAADGREVWMRDLVYVEQDEAGRPRMIRGIMLDITARKRVEEELRESSAAKDRFLGMLAHELRNPLGAVSNALEVLRASSPGQPAWDRALQIVERQVRHQAQLLQDLLRVARLTRGAVELHLERLDLRRLVEATAEDHRGAYEKAGLELSLRLPLEPAWIQGDPTQLTVVLENLLNNALKFTDSGGRVEVELASNTPEGRVVVSIHDTGVGLDAAMLARVWDVFAQADRSLERQRGGLGLGLPLVKGLVELHGGEVRAESPGPGQGATFTFELPLDERPEPGPDSRPEPRDTPSPVEPPAAPGTLRVLVIEDNADAADTLRDLLELFGHEVQVAYSGSDGIEAARLGRPDVVLCDIGLPGLDGYSVARQIRQDAGTIPCRLVALTGYGREADRKLAEEAGFDIHLVKPLPPNVLRQLLQSWAADRPTEPA